MVRKDSERTSNMRVPRLTILLMLCPFAAGCWSASDKEVVVYTALDSEFSKPIFAEFTAEKGIAVRPKFDTESTKTVGLANAILAESSRPRCDVFWNNEILNTLRLQRAGLLDAYRPPVAEQYPAAFRSPKGTWHGFAARARVLIVNTELVAEADRPSSIHDFADPKWRGRCGMAKPLFGTTATHAACLFACWGDEQAKEFFRKLKANEVKILSGNKQVALSVAGGELPFGLTDTDDAIIEKNQGMPVEIVYPDQGEGGLGTLFIPNTLAIIKGGPNPERARRLVDYLLSPGVEAKLAAGHSAQIPLNPNVTAEVQVQTPKTIQPMRVDFDAAAEKWDTAREYLQDEFTGG
ncbi:MAG: iron transporter [Planctomycetes bacterium RBG_13_63_9]|nr:MAG: iron transporter [Planctomycetes bacterium RBG_13_63_9]